LGICVGMQMLFETSSEFGVTEGLGLIGGRVEPVPAAGTDGTPHKIPHVGWSDLVPPDGATARWSGTPLDGLPSGVAAYFVHSFTAVPSDDADRLADVYYDGWRLSAAVRRGKVFGTQFHPEKSGPAGLRMIDNFLALD
jgi:imidazole glycerol-phosphate synthase subunit HisH